MAERKATEQEKAENARLAEEAKQSETEAQLDETGAPAGTSFYNEALTGSGTINQDGTYGPPQPDPTEVRGLGPDKTSGGRTVTGGGLGDVETERTGPTTSEDPATRKQASANRNR
jgi:hypothetical protein